MRRLLPLAFVALSSHAEAQTVASGRWEVTSTVGELAVPGVPGFLQQMARGRASSERKTLAAGKGIEALLVPDPRAKCTVDGQHVADGRYAQSLTCPQKRGGSFHVARSGTYDASGFVGRATVSGATPRGVFRVVLDQRAVRVGG